MSNFKNSKLKILLNPNRYAGKYKPLNSKINHSKNQLVRTAPANLV